MKSLIFILLTVVGLQAQALEYGCKFHPKELNEKGTNMVKAFAARKQSVPESLPVTPLQIEYAESNSGEETSQVAKGTLEGFYRPAEDDFYSLIPIPVLGIALSRERNMIYVCAHYDSMDPKKTHVTVYMLRGYYLDPTSLGTVIGNLASGPRLEVKPLTAALVDINFIRKDFLHILKWIPFVDVGLNATNGIQRLLVNMVGDFTGIGVERLTMTMDGVEIASGIDLKRPEKATIKKFISFDKMKKD
ncbi:hypothetical protein [Bdellovibrio sp. HCB2-146]|uniref:hypothetical protein n=1 Tax=Bdellovibrio sp. HCB2-146 TaxID=3394362 RepID=UPI0039BCCA08